MANASGTPEESLDYYPYGAQRFDLASSSLRTGRQFLGQFYDSASALDYLNARYLNGTQNQFLSEDPVFLAMGDAKQLKNLTGQDLSDILSRPQSLNSYLYADGNPIGRSDPKGLNSNPWTNNTRGLPRQAAQIQYNALRVGFGLPILTLTLPGTAYIASELPTFSPAFGPLIQGGLVNAGLRATSDWQGNTNSSLVQYLGDATFGALTAKFTLNTNLIDTAFIGALSSLTSGYVLDHSVNIKSVIANAAGASIGQSTSGLLKSVTPKFSTTSGNLTNYLFTTFIIKYVR